MTGATAQEALPVSVIIPAYNRADLLPRALRSALGQRPCPPAEIIVVDDCSADDTAAIAESFGVTVIRHDENRGEGGARNTAIAAASHEWLALLDSDDEWLPSHLDTLWRSRGSHVLLASSALSAGSADGERLLGRPERSPVVIENPAAVVFPDNPLPASGVLVRRDVVREVGAFRPLPAAADLDLWLRVLSRGSALCHPAPGYRYHVHAGQVSQDEGKMQSHLRELLVTYHAEPWCSDALVEALEVRLSWDRMRAAIRARRWASAARQAGYVVARRRRIGALRALLRYRSGLRERASTPVDVAAATPSSSHRT